MIFPDIAEYEETDSNLAKLSLLRLHEENFKLQARSDRYKCRIDKAIELLSQGITFCENDSQGLYEC